jgi:hypothetical protein
MHGGTCDLLEGIEAGGMNPWTEGEWQVFDDK